MERKSLKFCALFFVLFLVSAHVKGQVNGMIVSSSEKDANYNGNAFTGVGGSPFLIDNWSFGNVKLASGSSYSNLKLKYDVENNLVLFLSEEKEVQRFQFPVVEFTLKEVLNNGTVKERVFRSGFPSVDGAYGDTFYEVLVDGKTMLLKRIYKTIVAERAPSAPTPTNVFKTKEKYYVLKEGAMVNVRAVKKSVLDVLSNKTDEIDAYMQQQKLNPRDEKSLAQIVTYYNTL